MMMALGIDPEEQLVPLAFCLAEGENNSSWEWFMTLLRIHVIGKERTICLISDRHQGILNATRQLMLGYRPLEHRWCMRHFAANIWRRQKKREVVSKLKEVCWARTEERFKEKLEEL